MPEQYTIKDVTDDLRKIMPLTGLWIADDQGFWFDPLKNERLEYSLDANEDAKEIVLFQDPMPKGKFFYFNPYSEGFGRQPTAVQLFYKSSRIALIANIETAIIYMVQSILQAKRAAEAKEEYSISHSVTRMSSVPVDRKSSMYDVVDEKMIDEFKNLFKRMGDTTDDDCIHLPYYPKRMTTEITCGALTDPKWDEKFGKDVRKKSLLAFKSALLGVLGITNSDDLKSFFVKYDPETEADKSSPRFYTTLSLYLKIYSRFNDVLIEAYESGGKPRAIGDIDLGDIAEVIERSPLAYKIAKHMIQPELPKSHATETAPVDTGRLSIGGGNRRFSPSDNGARSGSRFAPEPLLSFGSSPLRSGTLVKRRFEPEVVNMGPVDPFAPVTAPAPSFGGNSFSMGGSSFGQNNQSMFGGSSFGGGGFSSPNFSPSNNFNSPGSRLGF